MFYLLNINSVTPHVSFDKNDSVTPCVFFHDDQRKTTVLPPMFYLINIDSVTPYVYFMMADKKWQSYPLCFFSWGPIKNNSVTPYILFDKDIFLFINVFFSWRPMKNESGTPVDVFAGMRIWAVSSINLRTYQCTIKTPLMFFFMTADKTHECFPLCFFSWRPIKNNSVTPYVFFMTTNKKQQCYPLCSFYDHQ